MSIGDRSAQKTRLQRAGVAAVAVTLFIALVLGTLLMAGVLQPSKRDGVQRPVTGPTASPSTQFTPAPTASPSAAPPLPKRTLIVAADDSAIPSAASPAMVTITVADDTGRLVTSTQIARMPPTQVAVNAATVMPRQVIVAAGAVYYSDPAGRIHRFEVSGSDTVVATFPLDGARSELSFAVSPDGRLVMATVMTTPPLHDPPPQDPSQPLFAEGQPWTVETFLASAGRPATSIVKRQTPGRISITRLVGWDAGGPIAVLDALMAVQAQPLSVTYQGGAMVHLALDGTHLDQLGGTGCRPIDLSPGGVVCVDSATISSVDVRTVAGSVLWKPDVPPGIGMYEPRLSPDGTTIASQEYLFTRDAAPTQLVQAVSGPRARAEGWIRSDLLMMRIGDGLYLVPMSDRTHPFRADLKGRLVGPVDA